MDSNIRDIVQLYLSKDDPSVEHAALSHLHKILVNPLQVEPAQRSKMLTKLSGVPDHSPDKSLASDLIKLLKHVRVNVQPLGSVMFSLKVDVYWSVGMFKILLEESIGVGVEEQHLVFGGKPLADDEILSDCNIEQGSMIHLVYNTGLPIDEPKWAAIRDRYNKAIGKEEPLETLRKLGYTINAGLEMRAISNGGRFVYTNEGNYAAIGEVISSFFESFLISEFGFLRHKIPISADPAESTTSVLLSRGAVNSELLLVIVPTHTVRGCGLWFRKACINDNLYIGSMINYIRDFIALGYKIILLNPNIPVSESRCPADHLVYVYDHIISKSISSSITWLCHQIGSQTLSHLLSTRPQVEAKSACYLLLDPVPTEFPDTVRASVFSKSRAWITTTETLGSVSRERQRIGCDAISLGTKSEILAPGAAQNLMFEWLRNQSNPALRRHFPTANIVRENSIRLEERERYWKRRLH